MYEHKFTVLPLTLKAEAHLHIYEFSPYLHHYKDQLVKEVTTVYSDNHTKPINIKYSVTDC
jgi:hypothetical protein